MRLQLQICATYPQCAYCQNFKSCSFVLVFVHRRIFVVDTHTGKIVTNTVLPKDSTVSEGCVVGGIYTHHAQNVASHAFSHMLIIANLI